MTDPYNVGTITVPNGGTTVTGTGTFWVGPGRKNDMLFVPGQGLLARITADAVSNTSLSITAWAGTDLTDEPYEIIPAADSTTNTARLRELLAQMSVVEANGQGVFYRFSDTTTDADPGAGYIRLNNADPALATAAYIDNLNANGGAMGDIIDKWDDSTSLVRGTLIAQGITDKTIIRGYELTGSVVDGTGYRKLTLTHIGGSGSFAADDELMVAFARTGDIGDGFAYDTTVADPSELTALEGETAGYLVFVTDLQTDFGAYSGRSGVVKLIAGPDWELVALYTGPQGATGGQGDKGWSPQLVIVSDGARRVHQLAGYVGGAGTAPTANVGDYLKGDGTFTSIIGDAADVRGPAGANGAGTVASLVPGAGIEIDDTDPANPIIINTGDIGGSGGINDAYLSLLQADAGLVGFIGGIADAFADQSGVDESLTTGESWSAGQYAPATTGGTSYANAGGTGDRTGSISVSTTFTAVTGTADNLVDGALLNNGTDSFVFTAGQTSGYFQFDFGSAKLFDEFKWEQQNTTSHGTWKWQGSNSPSSGYVDVGASFTLGGATTATVAVAGSTTPYRYWRLVIVSGSTSDAAWCREITFKIGTTAPTVSSMTVVSQAFSIDAQVDTANLLVRLVGDEAFDINSDVTAEVSRDGASWVLADLVAALTNGSDEYFVAGIDLSAEPPGTNMRWRIKTYGKSVRLTGASLQWGAPGLTLPLTSGTFSGPFPSDFPVDKLVAAYFFDEAEAESVRDVMGGTAIDLTGPTNPNATVTAKGILLQSGLVQTPLLTGIRCQTLLYRVAQDETGSKLLISGGAGSTSGAKPDTLTVGETHLYGGSGFDMHTPYFNSATGASAWELNRGGWGVYHRQDTAARDSVFGFGGEHSSTNFRVSEMEIGQAFFWNDVLTTDEVAAVFRFVRQRAAKLGIYLHRDDCPYREDVFVLLGDSTADGRAPWADLSSGDQSLDYRHTLIAAGDTSNVMTFDKFELGYNQQVADLNDVGPEIGIAYARRLVGKSAGRCRILKFGVGGSYAAPSSTGVPAAGNSWSPDEAVGSGLIWYALRQWQQSFQDMLREGIGWGDVKVACLLGLNDSTNDLSAPSSAAYQGYLQDILDAIEAQFSGAAVDFMLFRAHDSAPGSDVTALAAVRSGSDAFGAANSNVTVEDTDAIDLEADNVHYSAAGSKAIGALRHG